MMIKVFRFWVNSNTVEIEPFTFNGSEKEGRATRMLFQGRKFCFNKHPDEVAAEINRQIQEVSKG